MFSFEAGCLQILASAVMLESRPPHFLFRLFALAAARLLSPQDCSASVGLFATDLVKDKCMALPPGL